MKSIVISDPINLNFKLDELKENIKLQTKLKTHESLINYKKIFNLDNYNQFVINKFILYDPIDYYGFLLFADYFINKKFKQNLNILLDVNLIGILEIIKYLRGINDNCYISDTIVKTFQSKKLERIIKLIQFTVEKERKNTYDIIISDKFEIIEKYSNNLTSDGTIIIILNISQLDSNMITKINGLIKLFKHIEISSPDIIDDNLILSISNDTNNINKSNEILDFETFLLNHINKANNVLKNKINIAKITNIDIQQKLIDTYNKKIRSKIINMMTSYGIPVSTKLKNYYDNKLITINNKLYSSLNFIAYKFIKYDDLLLTIDINGSDMIYENLHKIASNLNKIKQAIDTRYLKKWQYITGQLDNFKSLGEYVSKKYDVLENKNEKVSNAFLKIYETLFTIPIIKSNKLKSFHFCEAPGMFIVGINHYLQTKTNVTEWEWFGNSLTIEGNKFALTDMYGIIKKNNKNWLIGKKASGDIRDIDNINYFKEQLNEVDFITSDCGISVEGSQLNKYEEAIAETDFAQFVNMINLLKIGGSSVIKTFIPLELASNVCLIYAITQLFEKVYLTKPITSRPQNSEIYIVCINFKGIEKKMLDELKNMLGSKFNPNKNWIKNIPNSFYQQLEDYIIDITRQQISYLLNIFYFVDNEGELEKIKLLNDGILKKKSNEYWCEKFEFEHNHKNKII